MTETIVSFASVNDTMSFARQCILRAGTSCGSRCCTCNVYVQQAQCVVHARTHHKENFPGQLDTIDREAQVIRLAPLRGRRSHQQRPRARARVRRGHDRIETRLFYAKDFVVLSSGTSTTEPTSSMEKAITEFGTILTKTLGEAKVL